jgi:molybdopterin/thiamine biosynthesis adenylyltransferase
MEGEKENKFFGEVLLRPRLFFTNSELNKIRDTTISVIGLGGVGAIVVELLARWGIKRFRLMDMDKYDMSNMNRQIFATVNTIGLWKVDVAKERILKINPYAQAEMVFREKLNKESVDKIARGADILIGQTDTVSSLLLLDQAARKYSIPFIVGSPTVGGSPFKAGVRVFNYRGRFQQRLIEPFRIGVFNRLVCKLLDPTKKNLDVEKMTQENLDLIDEQLPLPSGVVFNFASNLAGCLVVCEVIKLIANRGKTYYNPKQICFDLLNPKINLRSTASLKKILNYAHHYSNQILKNLKDSLIRKRKLTSI